MKDLFGLWLESSVHLGSERTFLNKSDEFCHEVLCEATMFGRYICWSVFQMKENSVSDIKETIKTMQFELASFDMAGPVSQKKLKNILLIIN